MCFCAAIKFRKLPKKCYGGRKTWDIVYSVSSSIKGFRLLFTRVVICIIFYKVFPLAKTPSYKQERLFFLSFLNPYAILVGFTTLSLFMT
jgi:cytochrome d ubiquinol oxidase subunit II